MTPIRWKQAPNTNPSNGPVAVIRNAYGQNLMLGHFSGPGIESKGRIIKVHVLAYDDCENFTSKVLRKKERSIDAAKNAVLDYFAQRPHHLPADCRYSNNEA